MSIWRKIGWMAGRRALTEWGANLPKWDNRTCNGEFASLSTADQSEYEYGYQCAIDGMSITALEVA